MIINMKILNKISGICLATLAVLLVFSCQQDELVKPSALKVVSSITIPAQSSEGTALTIYSDEDWMVDTGQEWLQVTPVTGSGTMDITIIAENNVVDGIIQRPRQGEIVIANKKGYTVKCIVYQGGDNYLGASEKNISEVKAMEDGSAVKLPDVQVMAATDEGFVASDETASIYIVSKTIPAIGSKVFIAGEKTTRYSLASLTAGEIQVLAEGEASHPDPVDLTANLDPEKAKDVVYVSTLAGILGNKLYYESTLPVSVSVLQPGKDIDIEKVNMHNIAIEAYYVGIEDGDVKLALVNVEDKGINEQLDAYFYDDFSWMKSFIDASGVDVGDSIEENNSGASAPNLRSNGALANLLEELIKRGYEDLNPSAKVIYPQTYYWKFGKTSKATANNNNGLILPPIEFKGDELVNAIIEFDWAAHMTSSGNIDNVQIVVEVPEGAGVFENGTNISDPFFTTQEQGQLAWQHASVLLKGASKQSRITIRPYQYASVTPDQQRWHLDNIKVHDSGIPYSDPVYANVALSEEVLTFEGTPSSPASFTIKSDYDWTLSKGLDSEWFDIDVFQGSASEEITVTVTCQTSTSVNLRHGVITLASADTRKNIHVVQSAAGGQLDPLISIATGNNITVLGEGDEFSADVQANVNYKVEISDEWITEVTAPATKAIVEKSTHNFVAAPNMTGADRTGTIRFYNEEKGIESVLTVKQENFEPRVDVTLPRQLGFIPAEGATFTAKISSNIDFTVSSEAVTLPVTSAVAGDYEVDVTVQANSGVKRVVEVVFQNDKYSFNKTVSFNQLGTNVLFADNFDWLAPLEELYSAANSGKVFGQSVEDNDTDGNAPNAYTVAGLKDGVFTGEFAKQGYIDLNPTAKVIYPQHYYLKMGKTGKTTGLVIPDINLASKTTVEVEFNWACHRRVVSGVDETDPVDIVVEVKDGDTVVYTSEILKTTQPLGKMEWQSAKVTLPDVAPGQRISIHPLDMKPGSKVVPRWYIDNIVVVSK